MDSQVDRVGLDLKVLEEPMVVLVILEVLVLREYKV